MWFILPWFTVALSLCAAQAHALPPPVHALPFSTAENADGARLVWWFINQHTPFPYTTARDFPDSPYVQRIPPGAAVRNFDLAWWPGYVMLFDGKDDGYAIATGSVPRAIVEKALGKPVFYQWVGEAP